MRRRSFILLAGGGGVRAAQARTAASGDSATTAWTAATGEHDLRRFVLAHALLAPNPHNRQPWVADLRNPDAIVLALDPTRLARADRPPGAARRAFARMALAATARGLVVHPNEQALQEAPELATPYTAIHAVLDAPAPHFTVQMLARLGRRPAGAAPADPAPRRGPAAHLVT